MDNTVSTDNSSETGENPLKTRLANMLINRVTLSESLNVIRDACVKRADEIVDNASAEDMQRIIADLELFENPPDDQPNVPEVNPSGPLDSGPVSSGPSEGSSGSSGEPEITPIGASGPMA
tara:strand:- start:179 stop:541 length:363 start_codon:yes stop_codon:yes gene_type:complete